jgi:hypothetical protein
MPTGPHRKHFSWPGLLAGARRRGDQFLTTFFSDIIFPCASRLRGVVIHRGASEPNVLRRPISENEEKSCTSLTIPGLL